MSRFFEGAPQQAEVMAQGSWSPDQIEAAKILAKQAWEKIRSSPADVVFERAIAKAYPSLSDSEQHDMGNEIYECIMALSQKEDPVLTGKISVDDFKRFIYLYLGQ